MGDLDCVSCVSDGLCVCSFVSVVVCVSPSKICVFRLCPVVCARSRAASEPAGHPRGVLCPSGVRPGLLRAVVKTPIRSAPRVAAHPEDRESSGWPDSALRGPDSALRPGAALRDRSGAGRVLRGRSHSSGAGALLSGGRSAALRAPERALRGPEDAVRGRYTHFWNFCGFWAALLPAGQRCPAEPLSGFRPAPAAARPVCARYGACRISSPRGPPPCSRAGRR